MRERIELANIVEERTALAHLPERIKCRRGKEQRKDHEIHDACKVLKLFDCRGDQHTKRSQHRAISRNAYTCNNETAVPAISFEERRYQRGNGLTNNVRMLPISRSYTIESDDCIPLNS